MTETVILTMPAAELASPASPRAAPRPHGDRSDDVAGWIAVAETRLQKVEEQARGRECAPGPAVAARAHELKAQLGADMSTAICVDLTRAEAGLEPPREPTPQDIGARAYQLAKESGGKLSTAAAVDQAQAEAAALASRRT